ncbi:autotransporter outer membrane beta-barrel domain-containing protein, partial [Bartonella sp. LJL80]
MSPSVLKAAETIYSSGTPTFASLATYDTIQGTSSSIVVTNAGTVLTAEYTNNSDDGTPLPQGVIHIGNGAAVGDTQAYLRVENGGSVVAQQSLRIGGADGLNSSVSVSGANSSLYAAQLVVGYGGANSTNTLSVTDGGRVDSHNVYAGLYADGNIVVSGDQSQLNVTRGTNAAGTPFGQLNIGTFGHTGIVTVENGGEINSGANTIFTLGGIGSDIATDTGSKGYLYIKDGGIVNAAVLAIGNSYYRSEGYVSVTGANSILNVGTLYVSGDDGIGQATVSDGGTINVTGTFYLSAGSAGRGSFYLGEGGTLIVGGTNGIVYGGSSGGYDFVLDGGTLKAGSSDLTTSVNMTLANGRNSIIDSDGKNITLSGNLSGSGGLEKESDGRLTLSGSNTFTGSLTVNNGSVVAASDGALPDNIAYIVNAGQLDASGYGFVASSLSGTGGTISLGVNDTITINQDVDTSYDGTFEGQGQNSIVKSGQGRLTLNGDSPTFLSNIDLSAGGIEVNGNLQNTSVNIADNAVLSGTGQVGNVVIANGGLLKVGRVSEPTLAADFTTGTIENNGTIQLSQNSETVGSRLLVNGNYSGNSGTFIFNTQLGDDSSPTDFLHVLGNSSGQSYVQVVNRGGLGALTTGDGIQLIKVDGTSSADNFSLKSDYSFEGQAAVVGGAYAYSLYAGNKAGDFAGDWYLRSLYVKPVEPPQPPVGPVEPPVIEPKPVYSAVVPMYEVYPQILQQLNKLGTLEQRIGNRTWIGTGSDRQTATINEMEGRGFWMKVEGSTGHINSNVSKTRSNYDLDMIKTQIGLDFEVTESDAGKLIGGA